MFSATWVWKCQQYSRKSIYALILLSPELRHAAVHESPKSHSVCELQSKRWESRYFVLYRGSKGKRHKISGVDKKCCQESVFEFPWWERLTSQNQTRGILPVKGWCFPMSLGSKISYHFPSNSLLQHISPNAYLRCSRFLSESQKAGGSFPKQKSSNLPPSHLHATIWLIPTSIWAPHHLSHMTLKSPGRIHY